MIHVEGGARSLNAKGYEQLTSLAAATPLTIPPGTISIVVTCEVAVVRFRDDGVDPTASVGFPLAIGAVYTFTVAQASQLRFIQSGLGGILNVCYYG